MDIRLVNNQPHAGLFNMDSFPVMDNDTVGSLSHRLHRMERNIKDSERVSLYWYADPVMGPRRIPALTQPLDGVARIDPAQDRFKIDVAENKVSLVSGGKSIDIGESLVYRV